MLQRYFESYNGAAYTDFVFHVACAADLLVFRPNSGTKREAKGYPRSEWFYLEDNAQEDKRKQDKENEE